MSTELKAAEKPDPRTALMAVIKKAIFKTADDSELALYIHKCTEVGVSPLSKSIVPIKFKDNKDGGFIVTFITTIDVYRSLAEETGEYDGQDEATFDGEVEVDFGEGKTIKVPEIARVNVYKKGVSRPTVGVARWVEYYPGFQRGEMWRRMPYGQLSKCAEANALRKAFPKKLNKLYTDEEMQLTTAALIGVQNIKDTIQEPTGTDQAGSQQGDSDPDSDTRFANWWISKAKENDLIRLCDKNKVDPKNVLQWLRTVRKNSSVYLCHISAKKPSKEAQSEYEKILQTVEKQPKFYDKYVPVKPAEQAPAVAPEPTAREVFEIQVQDLLESAGLGNEKLDAEVKASGFKSIKEVPEADFSGFLKRLGESL